MEPVRESHSPGSKRVLGDQESESKTLVRRSETAYQAFLRDKKAIISEG